MSLKQTVKSPITVDTYHGHTHHTEQMHECEKNWQSSVISGITQENRRHLVWAKDLSFSAARGVCSSLPFLPPGLDAEKKSHRKKSRKWTEMPSRNEIIPSLVMPNPDHFLPPANRAQHPLDDTLSRGEGDGRRSGGHRARWSGPG
jgi:hypothetical protein